MAAAEGHSYFCPLQPDLENVKIMLVDIRRLNGRYFRKILKVLKDREKKISPFEVEVGGFRVHVTPLNNPQDKRSSFHILRLWDSKDSRYLIDLLMQDIDLYFVGFRTQENGQWGKWYTFEGTDEKVDAFLGATKVHMKMSYPDKSWVTPGGSPLSFKDIFFQLRYFHISERVTNEFKRAVYSVMVIFCETRRLRSLELEICRRIDYKLPPQELSECHFEKMHNWASGSGIVLEANKGKALALGTELPLWWPYEELRLRYISYLIGAEGELLILKFNERYVRPNDKKFNFDKHREDPRSALVPDHDFIRHQ